MGDNSGAAGGGAIYGLGVFGAWVYFWQQADSFWEYSELGPDVRSATMPARPLRRSSNSPGSSGSFTDMTGSVITGIIAGTMSGMIGFALGWRARGKQQC